MINIKLVKNIISDMSKDTKIANAKMLFECTPSEYNHRCLHILISDILKNSVEKLNTDEKCMIEVVFFDKQGSIYFRMKINTRDRTHLLKKSIYNFYEWKSQRKFDSELKNSMISDVLKNKFSGKWVDNFSGFEKFSTMYTPDGVSVTSTLIPNIVSISPPIPYPGAFTIVSGSNFIGNNNVNIKIGNSSYDNAIKFIGEKDENGCYSQFSFNILVYTNPDTSVYYGPLSISYSANGITSNVFNFNSVKPSSSLNPAITGFNVPPSSNYSVVYSNSILEVSFAEQTGSSLPINFLGSELFDTSKPNDLNFLGLYDKKVYSDLFFLSGPNGTGDPIFNPTVINASINSGSSTLNGGTLSIYFVISGIEYNFTNGPYVATFHYDEDTAGSGDSDPIGVEI